MNRSAATSIECDRSYGRPVIKLLGILLAVTGKCLLRIRLGVSLDHAHRQASNILPLSDNILPTRKSNGGSACRHSVSLSSNHGDFATMFGGSKVSVLIANAPRAFSSESASIQQPSLRMEVAQHGSLVSLFRGTRWKNA